MEDKLFKDILEKISPQYKGLSNFKIGYRKSKGAAKYIELMEAKNQN